MVKVVSRDDYHSQSLVLECPRDFFQVVGIYDHSILDSLLLFSSSSRREICPGCYCGIIVSEVEGMGVAERAS